MANLYCNAKMKALAALLVIASLTMLALGEPSCESASSTRSKVPVSEVLEKLASGKPVIYSGKIINGSINLKEIAFLNESNKANIKIEIIDSEITGTADFSDMVFINAVLFTGTIFHDTAIFTNASFTQEANFNRSQFKKDAKFGFARFSDNARFECADFSDLAMFGSARFHKIANFANSNICIGVFSHAFFGNSAIFTNAEFQDAASFNRIIFNGSSFFDGSRFQKKAIFDETTFNGSQNKKLIGSINFLGSNFEDDASFSNTTFVRDATFKKTSFMKDVDFEESRFLYMIDFNDTSFRSDAIFWNAQFFDDIYLHGSSFSRFIVRWENIRERLVFGEVLYLSLIDNFKSLGRTDDANDCYYEYMVKKPKSPSIWQRSIDSIKWISCGYGVRPIRTVAVCLGMIILFGFLFWIGDGVDKSEEPKQNPSKLSVFFQKIRSIYLFKCIYFSTTVFISGNSDISPLGDYKYLVTIERIFGWLLFGLFLATLTRTLFG